MKTLEELGISPAPWRCATNDCGEFIGTLNRRGFYVAKFAYNITPNDARIFAAAPELYDALYDILRVAKNRLPSQPTLDELEAVAKAEAALAKASGESEVEK